MTDKQRVVIVGAGFAGYNAARELSALAGSIEIVVINATDYFLYLPLMPQVGGGLVEPRHICVSLPRHLPKVRFIIGTVSNVDPPGKTVRWETPAIYLRDHITRQLELAAAAADAGERAARCTFVVVGGGYTGTEVAAQGQLMTTRLTRKMTGLAGQPVRWLLLDAAPRLLPELDGHLSKTAERVLKRRGVEVRTGQSIEAAMPGYVRLSTGEEVPTSSLIWCVGVRPDPLVGGLGLGTNRGRLIVDEFMSVPGAPGIYACGDCAAVPDVTRPGEICGMTAQHAQRQGKRAARNVAAALGFGTAQPYKHHDLGFLVDLGGAAAAANPLGIPLSGPPANIVTRGYHLASMAGNRVRVAADWILNAVEPSEPASFGLVTSQSVPIDVNNSMT